MGSVFCISTCVENLWVGHLLFSTPRDNNLNVAKGENAILPC